VRKTGLVVVTVVAALFAGCSEGDLNDLARDTEQALQDAGEALEDLADRAEGPIREATDRAREAAEEAREASDEFRENPTTETRQALRRSEQRLDEVGNELEGLIDQAPQGVRSVLRQALDSLTELRRHVQSQLESS
jgi:ElaB/YqjD/DUF883 family membrane-anchored ribosome-binding protein